MVKKQDSFLDRLVQRRALARWQRATRLAPSLDLDDLRQLRSDAAQVRHAVGELLHIADGRLTMPMAGGDGIDRPLGADWAWRPALWRGPIEPHGIAAAENRQRLGDEVTLFHDCKVSELTLHQLRNLRERDAAPYGLRMDVFRFDGSFLSLVLDLPESGLRGMWRNHLMRLNIDVEVEKPLEIFCRLNVKHGPNTEQLVRELPTVSGPAHVDFDLAYTKMNEKRLEKAWVDLIFEGPQMNQVMLRDVTFVRHPRADI